jgi:hypothetical protein
MYENQVLIQALHIDILIVNITFLQAYDIYFVLKRSNYEFLYSIKACFPLALV